MFRSLGKYGLLLIVCLSLAGSLSRAQSLMTQHTRSVAQEGTARPLGHMASNQTLKLTITLPLRNQDQLDQLLKELYDPTSANYHQFLTVEQFTEKFGPTQSEYNALIRFANENGLTVTGTSPNRVNLDVAGNVQNVEKAFNVKMGFYQHPTESRSFFAPDREPTTNLTFSLWHVSGLDNYSLPKPAGLNRRPESLTTKSGATTGSGPSASYLGSDMRAAYYGGSLTGTGQTVGLLEYYGTNLADVTTYYKNAGQTNNVPITLLSVDGTSTSCVYPSCDDTEQTLDITQALGMAPGLSGLVVYIGSSDAAIFNAMATHSPLSAQLGSSWTWNPADPSTDDPYFKEFAAQGQNLFQASGDSAKWTTSGTASYTYPADDVYVTTVGGTDLVTASAGGAWASETAWSNSGGGISPHKYAIPSWQTAAAAGCASCSTAYRNGPDVSANANYTFYVCADQTTCTANSYGGTSFAAPMWAGYMALVNQQSLANGNGLLGFINPKLYTIGASSSYTTDFHDITSGSNGYSTTSGYDLVTGWGSPKGANLLNALATATTTTSGFTIAASPTTVSIAQGSTGTTKITSTVTGSFSSAIALTVTGLPTGVTAKFSSSSITGAGSSTLTFTVASTATAGSYTITVTGTSGSTTSTAKVTLTVTAPVFTIAVSPASGSVTRGSSGYVTVTTTVSGGFNASVALSVSGLPTGVTGLFNPTSIAAPGAGTSKCTFTASSSAKTGTYTVTITGKGSSQTHTTTLSLTIK